MNSMMILMRIHQYTYADTLKLQILFEQLKHQLTKNWVFFHFQNLQRPIEVGSEKGS